MIEEPEFSQCCFCETEYGSDECRECPAFEGSIKDLDRDVVGHCGKFLPRAKLCYPSMIDDLCPGCPLNGYEFEEELQEEETAHQEDCE